MLTDYLEGLKGKRVAVMGIGISNRPLIYLLAKAGARVTAFDKKNRDAFGQTAPMLEYAGATLVLGEKYLDNAMDFDVVFRTPSMRPDVPALLRARENGATITSEMEVFFEVCPCPIIAVTGSDGKTTTTTIIAEMLAAAGRRVWLGGNIGTPLLDKASEMRIEDIAVVELSSFQLMTMNHSPHIAIVTNISPNHLDIHKDMAEYISAKRNIFAYQTCDDILILNQDNETTALFSGSGEQRYFSRMLRPENGVYMQDDVIYDCVNGERRQIMLCEDIKIPGAHNVENYMAACAALRELVPVDAMKKVAKRFAGVEHRLELARELDNVKYYNDSIASSPTRTIAGLRCFKNKVILISGGYDKNIPFDTLAEEIPSYVKTLILCGATADKIENALVSSKAYKKGSPQIIRALDVRDATEKARGLAVSGDTVLFSPACASFDAFPNFMERGKFFKSVVNQFI